MARAGVNNPGPNQETASIYVNVHRYANTSAALAIALDEAARNGTIKKGELVALTVFGRGLTWGTPVLEWEKDTTKPK